MGRSRAFVSPPNMHTPIVFLCCIVGYIAAHNVRREAPYPAAHSSGYNYEPSQRLFWGNSGSNQVGGTGLWATLTNKFPFLNNMFGKIEVEPAYRSVDLTQQYFPNGYEYAQPQYVQPQYVQPQYIQPQYAQPQYVQRQNIQPQTRQNVPFARDVGLTDDAVIITPPDVPIAPEQPQRPQFPTRPQIPSVPQYPTRPPSIPQYPTAPQPAPEPVSGYRYDKPLYRLELPHK